MNFYEALRKKVIASNKSYRQNARDAEIGVTGDALRTWVVNEHVPDTLSKLRLYHYFNLREYGVGVEECADDEDD